MSKKKNTDSAEKKILKYYANHKKIIDEKLPGILVSHDEEDIHKLRVSIKRIKALFIMLSALTQKEFNAKKHYKTYRIIFSPTGQIRDIQLHRKHLKIHEAKTGLSFTRYKDYLDKKELEAKKLLGSEVVGFTEKNFKKIETDIKKSLQKFTHDDLKESAMEYIHASVKKLSQMRHESINSEKWHDIRKISKNILYVLELIRLFFIQSKTLVKLMGDLKGLTDEIGEWHDKDVLTSHVEDFLNNHPEAIENHQEAYELLLKSINEQ